MWAAAGWTVSAALNSVIFLKLVLFGRAHKDVEGNFVCVFFNGLDCWFTHRGRRHFCCPHKKIVIAAATRLTF
jgi:hypothetical protein